MPDTRSRYGPAGGVEEPGALSPDERHRLAAVGLQDVLLLAGLGCRRGSCSSHYLCAVGAAPPWCRPAASKFSVTSVADDHVADAAPHRVAARLQLGHHPLVGGALAHEPRRVGKRDARDRLPLAVQHARRAAGDDEPRGAASRPPGATPACRRSRSAGRRERWRPRTPRSARSRGPSGRPAAPAGPRPTGRADQAEVHGVALRADDRRRALHHGHPRVGARQAHRPSARPPHGRPPAAC